MNSRFRLLPVSRRHFIQRSGGIAAGAVLASGLIRPRRVELGVEFHALLAQPYPIVRFFDTEVARAGHPSLLASVTLLGGI